MAPCAQELLRNLLDIADSEDVRQQRALAEHAARAAAVAAVASARADAEAAAAEATAAGELEARVECAPYVMRNQYMTERACCAGLLSWYGIAASTTHRTCLHFSNGEQATDLLPHVTCRLLPH